MLNTIHQKALSLIDFGYHFFHSSDLGGEIFMRPTTSIYKFFASRILNENASSIKKGAWRFAHVLVGSVGYIATSPALVVAVLYKLCNFLYVLAYNSLQVHRMKTMKDDGKEAALCQCIEQNERLSLAKACQINLEEAPEESIKLVRELTWQCRQVFFAPAFSIDQQGKFNIELGKTFFVYVKNTAAMSEIQEGERNSTSSIGSSDSDSILDTDSWGEDAEELDTSSLNSLDLSPELWEEAQDLDIQSLQNFS